MLLKIRVKLYLSLYLSIFFIVLILIPATLVISLHFTGIKYFSNLSSIGDSDSVTPGKKTLKPPPTTHSPAHLVWGWLTSFLPGSTEPLSPILLLRHTNGNRLKPERKTRLSFQHSILHIGTQKQDYCFSNTTPEKIVFREA